MTYSIKLTAIGPGIPDEIKRALEQAARDTYGPHTEGWAWRVDIQPEHDSPLETTTWEPDGRR